MLQVAEDREEFHERADRAALVLYASVIESLGWATAALLDQDLELAERVIADDRQVDDRCGYLTGLIKGRISESAVAPDELEDLIGLLQMVPELERSADLAEHIAQRAQLDLGGRISPRCRGLIQSMCDVGVRMWQLSSRAFADRSRDLSFEINESDDELDNLSAALVSEAVLGGVEPAVSAELALVARFYERIGDHAVNLARRSAALTTSSGGRQLWAVKDDHSDVAGATARSGTASGGGAALSRLIRFPVLPSDHRFAELFHDVGSSLGSCGERLWEMVATFSDLPDRLAGLQSDRTLSQSQAGAISGLIESAFYTPYLRSDLHALNRDLARAVDALHGAGELLVLLNLSGPIPGLREQIDAVGGMTTEVATLLADFRADTFGGRLERLSELKWGFDSAYRRCVSLLYSAGLETADVLRWLEFVRALEASAERIDEVGRVIASIGVKSC